MHNVLMDLNPDRYVIIDYNCLFKSVHICKNNGQFSMQKASHY